MLSFVLLAALAGPAAHGSEVWPDLSTPASVSREGARDAALVIAIEDYFVAQDIPGAVANGRDWVLWLKSGHGVPVVKPLFNQQATRSSMLAETTRVAARVQPGGRLWVVFIGHGAPSESGDAGLLVGVDAQQTPASIEERGLPRSALLAAASEVLPADSEIVFVQDACFSGKTSRGDLAPGMAPMKAVGARLGPRVTALAAARTDEYAGPLSDGRRPAFSYLVLGALRGWGDRDSDGRVTAGEAVDYAEDALLQTTAGRSQTPELQGRDVYLARSAREPGPDLTALALSAAASDGPASRSAGAAEVALGGEAVDFAALAEQAARADAAALEAARRKAEAEAALKAERRRRLDAAAADVRRAAAEDYAVIESLVANPTVHGRPVLETWLKRYGFAAVTVDGQTEQVSVAEVAAVERALAKANELEARSPASTSSSSRPASGRSRSSHSSRPRSAAGRTAAYATSATVSVVGAIFLFTGGAQRASLRASMESGGMSLAAGRSEAAVVNRNLAIGYTGLGLGVAGLLITNGSYSSVGPGGATIGLRGVW